MSKEKLEKWMGKGDLEMHLWEERLYCEVRPVLQGIGTNDGNREVDKRQFC